MSDAMAPGSPPGPSRPARAPRVAAVAASAVAFVLVAGTASYPAGLQAGMIARGALAGVVAALALGAGSRLGTVARAVLGAGLGAVPLVIAGAAPATGMWAAAGIVTAAATAWCAAWIRERAGERSAVALALALVAGTGAWSLGLVGGPYAPFLAERREVYTRPVEAEHYAFDGELYLRTRALMQDGAPFYPAFQRAWTEDSRFEGRIASPLGFREPALFELWRVLPGRTAFSLLGWFLLFALVAVAAGWALAATYASPGVALLAPIGLFSSLAWYTLSSRSWFTFAEVWAAGLVLVALALVVRGRWTASALALVAAVAVRELAIVYAPVWLVAWWLAGRPRSRLPGLVIALAGSCVPIALHLALAPAAGQAGDLSLGTWLHSTGLPRLARALQHGMGFMPFGAALAPLLALAALAGAANPREGWVRGAMLAALLVPAAFLVGVSANRFDYYWGAILVPVVLATFPLAWARWLPAAAAVPTASPRR